jgi:hypothetical protein
VWFYNLQRVPMTIRAQALRWLAARKPDTPGPVYASKRYAPGESWTREKAWWIQIPDAAIRRSNTIHILCEAETGAGSFRHLQVPAAYLAEHRTAFATIGGDKLNLFLSAEPGAEFRDVRGPGKVSLRQFERADTAA